MFETVTALDIGTSSIKLLKVKTGIRNFDIISMDYQEISLNAEDSAESVSSVLAVLVRNYQLGESTVVTNLPLEKALIRNISFPFNDPQKIAEAIPYEAEENIPFRTDEIVMDFLSLKGKDPATGRVMLAAAPRENVSSYLELLESNGIMTSSLGLESYALYECYRYFNRIPDENVLQLDIGNEKTVLNLIEHNHLVYTRCIPVGISRIYSGVAELLNTSHDDARRFVRNLRLDLTSLENNYHKDVYKSLGITRSKLKKIFQRAAETFEEINTQVLLTLKSFQVESGDIELNRILISGGGSEINGAGMLISQEHELPVVALPFMENDSDGHINNSLPIAFGTMLSYINRKRGINFLRGEFLPDFVKRSRKVFRLGIFFAACIIAILIVNLIFSTVITYGNQKKYRDILNRRFRDYFNVSAPVKDPVAAAAKIVNKEKKEISGLSFIAKAEYRILPTLKLIITQLPSGSGFVLKNMVINETIIRIDGTIQSSGKIDEFKNRLTESKVFDSVELNTSINRLNSVDFSMVIKKITEKKESPAEGR